MTKRFFIYGALVVLLTIIGVITSYLLFGSDTAEVLSPAGKETGKAADQGEFEERSAEGGGANSANSPDDMVRVLAVKGSVSRFLGTEEQWNKLSVGESLESEARVKTGGASQVTLGVGKDSKIELDESAELTVGKTSAKKREFKLLRGRLSVDYRNQGRSIRIENQDGSAAAETEEGIFTVLNTGETVAVATKTGSIDLLAQGQTIAVRAGEQSVANKGAAPSRPQPIPVEVMLRIVDPGCRVQKEEFIVLKGRTTPGALVRVNEVYAKIEPTGQFSVRVPLRLGKNNIVVVTEDLSGHRKERVFPCVTVDPDAPIRKIDIRWGPSNEQEES